MRRERNATERRMTMRIPVGSCRGCNEDAPMLSGGIHPLKNGASVRCAFVVAEMKEFPDAEFIGVYETKKKALAKARATNAGILWIGQSPVEYWIVLR